MYKKEEGVFMDNLATFMRRVAVKLVLADLTSNLRTTWLRSNKDINKFREKSKDFFKGFLQRNKDPQDLMALKKAVQQATNNELDLVQIKNEWIPVPAKTITPGIVR